MLIDLTNGFKAKIDEEDWLRLNLFLFKWHASKASPRHPYAIVNVRDSETKRYRTLRMHRLILNASESQFVDHINGDTLDNRRSNLRFCTDAENQQNTSSRGGTSRFKGVSWFQRDAKWRVAFNWRGTTHFIGYYSDEIEAAYAYNEAVTKICEGFARLNQIPQCGTESGTESVAFGTELG
jgi:hypothetical protein